MTLFGVQLIRLTMNERTLVEVAFSVYSTIITDLLYLTYGNNLEDYRIKHGSKALDYIGCHQLLDVGLQVSLWVKLCTQVTRHEN